MLKDDICVSIPKRWQTFFRDVETFKNARGMTWGELFFASLIYNPDVNCFYEASNDLCRNNGYKQSLEERKEELQWVLSVRKKMEEAQVPSIWDKMAEEAVGAHPENEQYDGGG